MRGSGAAALLGWALAAGMLACLGATAPYVHSRSDYWVFRGRVGPLPEPNYLPFVAHRERLPGAGEGLVLCRWPDEAFPLRYHVEPPVIPGDLDDEFNPRAPEDYVAAVHRAFRRWEEVVGRPVRFRPVEDPERASVQVILDPVRHVEGEIVVGGMLRGESGRCQVLGPGPQPDRLAIRFAVSELYLFLVDEVGLLTPGQVEQVALHEIGHLLGASGAHSPLQGDLMYSVASDRRVQRLSEHDENTFRALYRLPPGQLYVRLEPRSEPLLPVARRMPPRLGSEVRDDRFGLSVRFPVGWQVIRTPRGWVAVDGVSWDYDASIQVIFLRGTLETYLARFGGYHRARGELVAGQWIEVDGERVVQVVLRSEGRTEETSALDWSPGEVLLVVADCAVDDYDAYHAWFQRVLLSLDRFALAPPFRAGSGP